MVGFADQITDKGDLPHGICSLCRKEDLASINEIYNWAVLNTTATFDLEARSVAEAERWFNSHQDARYPLIVLEIDGQVVGWGSLSPIILALPTVLPANSPFTSLLSFGARD